MIPLPPSLATYKNTTVCIHTVLSSYQNQKKTHEVKRFMDVLFTYLFNHNEDRTTDTEDSAMATLAIQGCSITPTGKKTPAAMGTPIKL